MIEPRPATPPAPPAQTPKSTPAPAAPKANAAPAPAPAPKTTGTGKPTKARKRSTSPQYSRNTLQSIADDMIAQPARRTRTRYSARAMAISLSPQIRDLGERGYSPSDIIAIIARHVGGDADAQRIWRAYEAYRREEAHQQTAPQTPASGDDTGQYTIPITDRR